jgi:hypothetical protein
MHTKPIATKQHSLLTLLAVLLTVFCALSSGQSLARAKIPNTQQDLRNCNALIDALRTQNTANLRRFGFPFSQTGRIEPYVSELVNSMLPVLRFRDLSCTVLERYPDSTIRVIVSRYQFQDLVRRKDRVFLKRGYARSYFACDFAVVQSRWRVTPDVCFSETHGPYEDEPD